MYSQDKLLINALRCNKKDFYNITKIQFYICQDLMQKFKQDFHHNKKKYFAKCINQNQALFVCQSSACEKFPFQCINSQCSCKLDHQECLRIQFSSLVNKICSKRLVCEPLKTKVNQIMQKLIDFISQLRDNTIERIQCFGLNKLQEEFINSLEKNEHKSINGKLINEICKNIFQKQTHQIKIDEITKQINSYWQNWENKTTTNIVNLCKIATTVSESTLSINDILNIPESSIIQTKDQVQTLVNFFQDFDQKVIKFQLLFKASQNSFSINKFHQVCDDIEDTVILIQTNFNKKIGGYTTLIWTEFKNHYIMDNSECSFIFSLTNKDKFELIDKRKAIKNRLDRGPIFGYGYDLLVNDNANQTISYANISTSYKNQKYSDDDESYKRFSGGDTSQFSIKEWQVYKVVFQGDEQN